jgi:solute carrier family 30 (zinc transporter), member 2
MEKENRLILAIGLSSTFMIVEVIGGYLANSIAIYSDAAHLLTDIAGFGIALVAAIASKSPGTKTLTFGFARAEVFGALGSVLSLWVITAFLLYAAYDRAIKWFAGAPEEVDGFLMFAVACFGVLVNICLG